MNRLLLGLAWLLLLVPGARSDTKLEDRDGFWLCVTGAPPEFTEEYNQLYLVTDDTISIPNLGLVKAAGLTASELATSIEKGLRDR